LQENPRVYGRQLGALQAKIDNHLENQPPTPYREAILHLKRRVESARRGESIAVSNSPGVEKGATPAQVGQRAPDFTTTDISGQQSLTLKNWLGTPALLVFYQPGSRTAEEILQFAQQVKETYSETLHVVAFALADEADAALKQQADLHSTLSFLRGSALRQSYGVEATPKLMILDAKGVIRASHVGWGTETATTVLGELKSVGK
jgi:peroxiredoxin